MTITTGQLNAAHGMPDRDPSQEARRLLSAARAQDIPIRLIGGLAVRLHLPVVPPSLAREYKDIDLVTVPRSGDAAGRFLEGMGYIPDSEFNALNGHRRLLYADVEHNRRLDVFVGQFAMCHEIPVTGRLHLDPISIPLAELLLTKLQIVELNDRDLRDILAIVHGHEVTSHDDDAINADRVADLCAADWGLWRTCVNNLETTRMAVPAYALDEQDQCVIAERLKTLHVRIDAQPKSRRWKLRSRVGDRKRWYELPEEVE